MLVKRIDKLYNFVEQFGKLFVISLHQRYILLKYNTFNIFHDFL